MRLRWTGNVVRMKDVRIPKTLLYGRLATGVPRRGNHSTYLNSVKSTLRACDINCTRLEELAANRDHWRGVLKTGIAKAEDDQTQRLIVKLQRYKAKTDLARLHSHPASSSANYG